MQNIKSLHLFLAIIPYLYLPAIEIRIIVFYLFIFRTQNANQIIFFCILFHKYLFLFQMLLQISNI